MIVAAIPAKTKNKITAPPALRDTMMMVKKRNNKKGDKARWAEEGDSLLRPTDAVTLSI